MGILNNYHRPVALAVEFVALFGALQPPPLKALPVPSSISARVVTRSPVSLPCLGTWTRQQAVNTVICSMHSSLAFHFSGWQSRRECLSLGRHLTELTERIRGGYLRWATQSTLFLLLTGCLLRSICGMEIVAHRGASADAPENSLTSMKLAWEQGADAIELDLWLSKDGKLIVFHDGDTKRFEAKARRVPSLSWEDMQALDIGALKGAVFRGEHVPTLESILATVTPGHRVFLEIKCGSEILPELNRVLAITGRRPSELAVISFDFETLRRSKVMFPQVPHYYLHGYKREASPQSNPELAELVERCRTAGLDGLNLHYDWPITREFVTQVHSAGLKLFVWTVDDPIVARQMTAAGVDGITTNRPRWLREQIRTTK